MSDAFVPTPDAMDQQREDLASAIGDPSMPITAPEPDVIEQRLEPNGDEELDEHR